VLECMLTDSPDFDHPEQLRAELVSGTGRFIAVVQKVVSKGPLD